MASRGAVGGGRRGGGGRGSGGQPGGEDRGRGIGGQPQPYGRGDGGAGRHHQPLGRGEGGGRGRGRGGVEAPVRPAAPPRAVVAPAVVPAAAAPASAPASSSSSAPAPPFPATSLARGMGRLAVADPAAAPLVQGPAAHPPLSSKGIAHPARPGFGTVGRKLVVRANHFLVRVADSDICHYDVSISPEPKARRINRVLLSEIVKVHGATSLAHKKPAYDGSKSLYTAGELPFKSMDFVVKLGKECREIEYKVTIRYASRANLYHLQQFLNGQQRDSPHDTIQALDVVLRESPSLNYVTVSRSFFSKEFGGEKDIGDGLECWRGYYQSLRPTQMGLSLNIDTCSTAFYKSIHVVQFVNSCLRVTSPAQPFSDRDRLKIKKALRGVRVETTHQEGKSSTYKITGISSVPLAQLKFTWNEGHELTIVQYFAQRYNYRLQYTAWPCLQSGSDSNPIYLPMEVCQIIQGQKYPRKLSDAQVASILKATCKRPQEREQNIIEASVLHT